MYSEQLYNDIMKKDVYAKSIAVNKMFITHVINHRSNQLSSNQTLNYAQTHPMKDLQCHPPK